MRVGFIGLGKLGLPLALAYEKRGHEVFGYDKNPNRFKEAPEREVEADEHGDSLWDFLQRWSHIKMLTLEQTVERADFLFVVVDTPPEDRHIGETDEYTSTFDMTNMDSVLRDLQALRCSKPVVVASTCLPGYLAFMRQRVSYPLIHIPQFTAMGRVVRDAFNPEFVIIGYETGDMKAVSMLVDFYTSVVGSEVPFVLCNHSEAELIKTAYNGSIMWKINYVNTLALICENIGADVDIVTKALEHATTRLFSTMYWRAGGGDGGPCHPKDNAMLATFMNERYGTAAPNPWAANMRDRAAHSHILAQIVQRLTEGPAVYIVGKGFKRGTGVSENGWPLYMQKLIAELGYSVTFYDPLAGEEPELQPATYFIATDHEFVPGMTFPEGSTVIDPWGVVPDSPSIRLLRIGRRL